MLRAERGISLVRVLLLSYLVLHRFAAPPRRGGKLSTHTRSGDDSFPALQVQLIFPNALRGWVLGAFRRCAAFSQLKTVKTDITVTFRRQPQVTNFTSETTERETNKQSFLFGVHESPYRLLGCFSVGRKRFRSPWIFLKDVEALQLTNCKFLHLFRPINVTDIKFSHKNPAILLIPRGGSRKASPSLPAALDIFTFWGIFRCHNIRVAHTLAPARDAFASPDKIVMEIVKSDFSRFSMRTVDG